jgi:hypothetical protein
MLLTYKTLSNPIYRMFMRVHGEMYLCEHMDVELLNGYKLVGNNRQLGFLSCY